MKNTSSKFDVYIAKAPAYAQPILKKLRALFHQAYPDIHEAIKWGHLTFEHKGIVAGMAAHTQHVRFGFWKAKLVGAAGFATSEDTGYGAMKLAKVSELPADKVLIAQIKRAVKRNEEGIKLARPKPATPRPDLQAPDYLIAALKKNKAALKTFEGFTYSNRKDYVEWLTEAKQQATREKRLASALEWMAEGKSRNWKYMR